MYPGLSSAAIAAPTGDGGDRRGTSGGNRAERGRRERKKEKICEIDKWANLSLTNVYVSVSTRNNKIMGGVSSSK
jgi:hypothetical protein